MALLVLGSLPFAAPAQQRIARVGYLTWTGAGPLHEETTKSFVTGLRDEGFVEGRNLVIEHRSAEHEPQRFTTLAQELTARKVDVIFAPATVMAAAAWRADGSTPIVIATILDPVELEFVKSLARPMTRVTGVTIMSKELTAKRMQLLMETIPGLKRVGVVVDEAMRDSCTQEIEAMAAAAAKLGLTLVYVHADSVASIDGAFRKLVAERAQAVTATLTSTRAGVEQAIAEIAVKYRLPFMSELNYSPSLGSLISYGPDFGDVFRRAGNYVGRILKGGKPAEMPMEEPRQFRLIVNLRTAKMLGIAIPPAILLRADRVIE